MSNQTTDEVHTKLNILEKDISELTSQIKMTVELLKKAKMNLANWKKEARKHKMIHHNMREYCQECGYVSKIY